MTAHDTKTHFHLDLDLYERHRHRRAYSEHDRAEYDIASVRAAVLASATSAPGLWRKVPRRKTLPCSKPLNRPGTSPTTGTHRLSDKKTATTDRTSPRECRLLCGHSVWRRVGDLSCVERLASWGICGLVQCKFLIHLGIPHEAAGARGLCVECTELQRPDHRGLRVRHPDGKVCCLRRSTTLAPYGQAARA